jgi:hypothetical protein
MGQNTYLKYYHPLRNCQSNSLKWSRNVFNLNSYSMHSENILLAMATDKDEVVRSRAYKIIMSIRRRNAENESSENNTVRIFTKPLVHMKHPDEANFDPTDSNHNPDHYSKLFDWRSTQSTFEPPFTKHLSLDELKYYKNSKEDIIEVPALPCHSQATEYNVQIVKNIVTKYAGYENQDQRIKTKILSRSLNKEFDSHCRKSDYQTYQ